MKARLSAIGQRLVAGELAPGEGRGALAECVLNRLRDQVEGTRGIVELGLPALDAGKPGFQRPGQAADRGIAGHDLDQGRGRFELPGDLGHLFDGEKQQPVLFKEFARSERRDRFEMLGVALELFEQRLRRGTGQFGGRRLHHGENQPLAIECLLELDVALAPVQVLRNQGVDIGVDGKVAGGVIAPRDRKHQRKDDDRDSKSRARSNNRDNDTCQHIISF